MRTSRVYSTPAVRAARMLELEQDIERMQAEAAPGRSIQGKINALRRMLGAAPGKNGVSITECRVKLENGEYCRKPRHVNSRCVEHQREFEKQRWATRSTEQKRVHLNRRIIERAAGLPAVLEKHCEGCGISMDRRRSRYCEDCVQAKVMAVRPVKVQPEKHPRSKAPKRITIDMRPCMNEPSIPKPVEMFPTPTSDQLAQVQRIPAAWELRHTDWSDFDERKQGILEGRI